MLEDKIKIGLTFDDVLLVPQKSDVLPGETAVSTHLTRNIQLNIPIISAAMDTVTDARFAIAIAQEGGIGIIHRAMSIEKQAAEVKKVKKFESAVITDPITLNPNDSIQKILCLIKTHGFSSFPVTNKNGKLIGIITDRDLWPDYSGGIEAEDIMTPAKKLITAKESVSTDEAQEILYENKIEKLPIVGKGKILKGLITREDIEKRKKFPNACKDEKSRLRVGAAVGTTDYLKRALALIKAGVDVIAVDTAHGHSTRVLETVRVLRKKFPDLEIIGGNAATAEATADLIKAGASAVKVGVGPGSICTTRIVSGVGYPQLTAIKECSEAAAESGTPIIADGGIKFSGDITKAIAAGASCVMIGGLFAGTDESPGEMILFQGRTYKVYRGMGSIGAMEAGSKDRYAQEGVENKKLVPEGIEGRVPCKGPLSASIYQLVGGLRSGMGYCGCRNITELHEKAQFLRITPAGLRESHVHDVEITREAPNYQKG